jgi:hypothetical protein
MISQFGGRAHLKNNVRAKLTIFLGVSLQREHCFCTTVFSMTCYLTQTQARTHARARARAHTHTHTHTHNSPTNKNQNVHFA